MRIKEIVKFFSGRKKTHWISFDSSDLAEKNIILQLRASHGMSKFTITLRKSSTIWIFAAF